MSCNCFNLRLNAAGYPFTWASNYGGQIQFNTMPEWVSADMAYRIQNNWLNQGNMFSGCSGFMPGYQMYPGMCPTYPTTTMPVYPGTGIQQGMTDPTVQGYIDGRKTRIGVIANNTNQNLSGYKTQLEALANDSTLTEEQKKQVNEVLKRINQIQTEIQKVVMQAQMANNPQILDQLNNQIEALAGIAQELQVLIPELLQTLIAEAEQVPGNDDDDDDDTTTTPGGDDTTTTPGGDQSTTPGAQEQGDVQVIAPEGSDPQESLITTQNRQVSPEVLSINERIFDAVNGVGTKDKQLREAVEEINKDNVLDVFDNWNASYAPDYINDDKGGLIETIYDDKSLWFNGGKHEVTHILNALMEKAAELGNDALQAVNPLKAKINSELNSFWNTDEDMVAENINKIVIILNAYQSAHPVAANQGTQQQEGTEQQA